MLSNSSILVADFLKRENNNLDIFRIFAACLVIVGHSYVLFPDPGETDLIREFTGFTYSAALAVKIFFFISGLVVTNSILSSKSFSRFTISRFFRIFPALIFLCAVTVFVIGPLITTETISDYFNSPLTMTYFKNNIRLKTEYDLPGVFISNHYGRAVNGSPWTLPYELGCYLFLLGIFCLGILKNKTVASIVFGIIIVESVLPQRIFTYWINSDPEILPLPAYFSLGALLAINQEKIKLDHLQTIGLLIITFVVWNTRFNELLFCLSVFSLILNLSRSKWLLRLKIKNDISYGIYLWGFVVQQLLQHYVKRQTVYLKMVISIVMAVAIAYISWFVIEKNSIKLGKYFINKLSLKF